MIPLPPRSVLHGILARAFFLWVLVKAISMYLVGSGPLSIVVSIYLVLTVVALALLDMRTFRERVFLANLGVPRRTVALITALVAAVMELLVSLLLNSFGPPA